ncbi:MAG: 4Fe-4S dicluster domain-containing protein [Thermodesulfobacteriota bacterium]
MKVFVVDIAKCNGCYCCQLACKDEHVTNDWTPYAKPQPDVGQFWIGVTELVRGTVPKVMLTYIPKLCMHCDDAPCIQACKAGAIYKRDDGLVIIDPTKCTGHGLCSDACPHGVIYFNKDLNISQKCTGCAHLLDNDDDLKVPRCVDACPIGALRFGDESDYHDVLPKAELLNPQAGTKSRVYYLNLPRKWIAGTLYDPEAEEVVIGATCTLTNSEDGKILVVETDNFGDFWFRGLQDNQSFSLAIQKDGKQKVIELITTEVDRNLGDIALA